MGNKQEFHFIIKEDYLFDESMLLNAHKMVSKYEKKSRISF